MRYLIAALLSVAVVIAVAAQPAHAEGVAGNSPTASNGTPAPMPPHHQPGPPPMGKDGKPLPPPLGKDGKPLPPPPPLDKDGKPIPPPPGAGPTSGDGTGDHLPPLPPPPGPQGANGGQCAPGATTCNGDAQLPPSDHPPMQKGDLMPPRAPQGMRPH